ncbi:hypothetical protein GE061_012318 [Apolygus lucorum]|uniref:Uncharacterized protein n=1 Tax=Apolygus lucorum TaxID=248454 RepID=A0A8S9XS64_APOLU|nr:hypothetical protein GE061_012318 [Apolygus lucorum]
MATIGAESSGHCSWAERQKLDGDCKNPAPYCICRRSILGSILITLFIGGDGDGITDKGVRYEDSVIA